MSMRSSSGLSSALASPTTSPRPVELGNAQIFSSRAREPGNSGRRERVASRMKEGKAKEALSAARGQRVCVCGCACMRACDTSVAHFLHGDTQRAGHQ
eukprot:3768452-Rhodomonas_salina.1